METYATENLNIEIVEKRKHTMTSTIERFSQVERLAGRIKSSYWTKINDVFGLLGLNRSFDNFFLNKQNKEENDITRF